MTVFDANTFGPDEAPVEMNEEEFAVGYTKCVLIDMHGYRIDMGYYIGWYDHNDGKWRFKDDSHAAITKSKAKKIGMRWSFLPLAIYETNPELRKTVKI